MAHRKNAVTFKEASEHTGIPIGTLQYMIKHNGLELNSLKQIDEFLEKRKAEAPKGQAEAKLRKTLLECDRLDAIVKKERAELILRTEVYESAMGAAAMFTAEGKAMLNDLPAMLCGLPDENAIRAILVTKWNILMTNLAERLGVEIAKE